jgi:hypothetical protein
VLIIDNQIRFLDTKSRDGISHWLYRRWYHCQKKKREANIVLSACAVGEDVLRAEWAAQVQDQTKPLPRKLAHRSINVVSMRLFLGQSRNQASHAIDSILALEKSLASLNENIRSLELQLMGNAIADSTDFSDVLQELEGSRTQHGQIVQSLYRKRVALGVDERAHLTLLCQNDFLRIRMNAQSLKQRIRDRLRQRKFELEKLERAYRHTINGKRSQLVDRFTH